MTTIHHTKEQLFVIDAQDARLGRMATHAAKAALEGKTVVIVNCEEAVITGTKQDIMSSYIQKREMGRPTKGPFWPRNPDRFVRRIVRGMLPYKTPRGRDAYERVMCYSGVPAEFAGKGVQLENGQAMKRMKVKDLCNLLGGRT